MSVKTAPAVATAARLSAFRGRLSDFERFLAYPTTRRGERQREGDLVLLTRLEELRRGGRVGQIDADRLRDLMQDVEDDLFDRGWHLAGDDTGSPIERLDAHFAALQEAWAERQVEVEARKAAQARDLAETKLNDMRCLIGFEREGLKALEDRIAAMERELKAEAERLGVPAWPG